MYNKKNILLRNLSKYLSDSRNMTGSERDRDTIREGNMQIIWHNAVGTYELLLRSMTA
jgi:hypothetical protein